MSNYTTENLTPAIPVPGVPAIRVGDQVFVMQNGGGGGGSSLVDLIQVTSYTAPVPSFTVPEVYSLSGLTSAANPWDEFEPGFDFSVLNGTYSVTSDTASATDQLNRVYKHDSANYYLKHYGDEYDHYWLLGESAEMGPWEAMLLLSTDQPLNSGTATWNSPGDYSQTVTAAITSSAVIPAVPMTLTGQKITSITESAYDSSRGVRTFVPNGSDVTFSATDETPVVSGLAMTSGGRMIMQLRDSCNQTYGQLSSGLVLSGNGNSQSVAPGWIYLDTTLNSGGILHVSSGGTVVSTIVNSGGILHVSSGGTAASTIVNSGGGLRVSGGTANNITINPGGSMSIDNGGIADNIMGAGGALWVGGGTTATGVQLSAGSAKIDYYGSANDVWINSGARMDVYLNATVTSLTVSGLLDVFGSADQVHICSGGTMYQREGATITNLVVDEGGEVQ